MLKSIRRISLTQWIIISMVIAQHGASGLPVPPSARVPVAVATAFLSLLMVSTVRYRTFKDLRLSKKSATVFMCFIVDLPIGMLLEALRPSPATRPDLL